MRGKLFLLSFLSAGLLTAAWPPWGFTPLLFVAFVPLLYVQHIVAGDNRLRARHLFLYAYLAFLTWNALTTWWVSFASFGGAIMAITCNALLMTFVFLVFHKIRRALPERIGAFAIIPVWISFEYLHLDWDLTWPWLTLGNGLAKQTTWIQWYEYTGVFGGSLWILLINVLIFEILVHRKTLLRPKTMRLTYNIAGASLLVLPIVFSMIRYAHFDVKANTTYPLKVVVVQPNVDPYQKFNLDFRDETEQMLALAEAKIDSTTDYLVFPETALVENIWENELVNSWSIHRLRDIVKKYPKLKIVTGAATAYEYKMQERHSLTARKYEQKRKEIDPVTHDTVEKVISVTFYDAFNTAIQVDCTQAIAVYHKSKLVPGVEKMPFPMIFGFLEKYAIDMGGTSGSLGVQEERTVFKSPNGPGKIAPVICYESIYGDFVSQYVRNGADYIFIITNDGWWGDTPGYKQHLLYGAMRAIETRKSIARSANTGISCFIDQRGDIHQAQPWWHPAAISQELVSTAGQTFYTRHGDYIAKIMLWLTLAAIIAGIVRFVRRRMRKA